MTASETVRGTGGGGEAVSRAVRSGAVGAVALGCAGAVEGWAAFAAFRVVHGVLFPRMGEWIMTALTSGLPVVLGGAGVVFGGVGMAAIGARKAGQDGRAFPAAPLRNAALGTAVGVFLGGLGGLALGRGAQPPSLGLFTHFFYGCVLGFLLGLIGALILSARRGRIGGGGKWTELTL